MISRWGRNMSFRNLVTKLIGDIDDLNSVSLPKVTMPSRPAPLSERQLIEHESQIGAGLFGPVPAGHRREFFCLDDTSWIWYEEWRDEKGQQQKMTIRYEIQKTGVLKVQEGARYSYLEGAELTNFLNATNAYYNQVMARLYGKVPAAA